MFPGTKERPTIRAEFLVLLCWLLAPVTFQLTMNHSKRVEDKERRYSVPLWATTSTSKEYRGANLLTNSPTMEGRNRLIGTQTKNLDFGPRNSGTPPDFITTR